jgi:hypothetical protein
VRDCGSAQLGFGGTAGPQGGGSVRDCGSAQPGFGGPPGRRYRGGTALALSLTLLRLWRTWPRGGRNLVTVVCVVYVRAVEPPLARQATK